MAIGSRAGAAPPSAFSVRLALITAAGLVVLRSLIFILYEQAFFDSDQAIVGLMAKHLVEGTAFPLFYYGQGYLLGIDALAAAPVFLVLGPTVAALHIGVVALNIVAMAAMLLVLVRAGLTPAAAVGSTIFFSFAPPLTSASLIEAGANIGPIVAVPLMWLVRTSPVALGSVAALGFVNREFTIYGVLALLALEFWRGRWWTLERIRFWLVVLAAATAVMAGVAILKPLADSNGPGTRGTRPRGFAGDAATNITSRMEITPSELPARTAVMVRDHLPELLGLRTVNSPIARQGYEWLFWPVVAGLLLALGRMLWLTRLARPLGPPLDAAWYFTLVGAAAVSVYILSRPAGLLVPRYLLLSVFLPIGIVSLFLAVERRRLLRQAAAAVLIAWTCASAWDHLRQVHRYVIAGEPNETRELVKALDRRGITIARAGYWIAYKVSFLSEERVKIASDDVVRVTEYQRLADAAGPSLLRIQTEPCENADRIEVWYVCLAGN